MLVAALLFASALKAPPDPDLGRYAVKSGARTVCILTFTRVPDVGGQVEPSKACPPPLNDAARWFGDDRGGYILNDPIRQRVGEMIEDEAGLTLKLAKGGRTYDVEKLDQPPARTDAERAAGRWAAYGDVPGKVLCRIEFKSGGLIGPAPSACPAALKPFGGGRWRADGGGVRLSSVKGQALTLRWGDAVSLLAPRGTLMLLHD